MSNEFRDNAFDNLIQALTEDPQFIAVEVMMESLAELLPQMSEQQQMATQKLIAQFARALNQAGVLQVPKGE